MDKTRSIPQSRKTYSSPQVKRWGTVSEVTKVGKTNPGFDIIPGTEEPGFGSVYPRG